MMQREEKGEAVDLDRCCALMIFFVSHIFTHCNRSEILPGETREELGLLLVQPGNKRTKRDARVCERSRERGENRVC